MRRQSRGPETTQASASKERRTRTQTFSPYRVVRDLERQQIQEDTQYPSTKQGKSMSPLKKQPISGEEKHEQTESGVGPAGSMVCSQSK